MRTRRMPSCPRWCRASGKRIRLPCLFCPWSCFASYVPCSQASTEAALETDKAKAMLSELLSANLCTPFLLPMVEGKAAPPSQTRPTLT